jgi:hypothetical protein
MVLMTGRHDGSAPGTLEEGKETSILRYHWKPSVASLPYFQPLETRLVLYQYFPTANCFLIKFTNVSVCNLLSCEEIARYTQGHSRD